MKKIATLLLSLCLTLGLGFVLIACGNGTNDTGGLSGGGEGCQHNLTYFSAVEGSCDAEGRIAYYLCGKCGERFTDENAQNRITSDEQLSSGFYHKNSTHYDAVSATCSQVGNIEYTYCPTCQRYLDANNNSIDRNTTSIYAIEAHNFVNGACTECESLFPSTGLAIDNNGMVCGIGDCVDKDIIIPNSYEKDGKIYPVMGIDRYAFDGANDGVDIDSVRITKGVGIIKHKAFYNLGNLRTVIIEGKIEFESDSFYCCSNIETIELGEGITELVAVDNPNYNIFSNSASNLQNLYLPSTYNSSSLGGIYSWQIENFNTYCGGNYLGNETNPYIYLAGAIDSETEVTEIHENCKIIGDNAFYHEYGGPRVTGTIPNSVKIIGERAFNHAFINDDDRIINISANVEYIGDGAFAQTHTGIVVDEDNKNYKTENYSLFTKDGKTLLYACVINENGIYSVPQGVEKIGAYAFERNGMLTGVTLPNSLTSIGERAFANCINLVSVTIPSSVEAIGNEAFGITPIIYVEGNKHTEEDWRTDVYHGYEVNEKVIFDCKNNDVAEDGNIYVVTDNYIYSIKNEKAHILSLGAIEITDSVVILPESVSFKNVAYPVTTVSRTVIEALTCTSLTIPDCYELITDTFDVYEQIISVSNENIKELTIGAGLIKVPYFCMELDAFRYGGSVEDWLDIEFEYGNQRTFLQDTTKLYIKDGNGFKELTSVTIPDGSVYFGQFGQSDSITEVIVKYGASIEKFGDWSDAEYRAFNDNTVIKFEYYEDEIDLEIPDFRTVIYAFGEETGTDGTFDYSILAGRVKITAYKGNSELLTIPERIADKPVTDFGTVFSGNTTFTTLVILAKVDEIKSGAFANCTNLSWVYINGYVDNIKSGAFTNLNIATVYASTETKDYLTTGIYFGTNEQVKESGWIDKAYPVHYSISFDPASAIAYIVDGNNKTVIRYVGTANTLTMPGDKGFASIRAYAFAGCDLTEVVVSDGITEIGSSAFEGCSSLTKITIPASVVMIGADAFKNSALTNVNLENKQNWYLVEYATQTLTALDSSVFASEEALATYIKNNLITGYVLIKNTAI